MPRALKSVKSAQTPCPVCWPLGFGDPRGYTSFGECLEHGFPAAHRDDALDEYANAASAESLAVAAAEQKIQD